MDDHEHVDHEPMDDPVIGWPQAMLGFAAAFAVVGVFWAAGTADSKKHSSPEYWHYQHHWSVGTTSDCNSSRTFIQKSRSKND